ncbi:hypothetical protein [Spirosoma fluviale]|uniref:Uncharacterized protein n=1 Tax=Spirosoma fluviale TaxID=1597977 RepID=A0A286FB31_9BACT|nr:hypothetical protein [Spirosoma fluviale]SOD80054.1 hypothetical protein SAMN06269250_1210 [Spirosoma fluviale]
MTHTAQTIPSDLLITTTSCHQDNQHWKQIIRQQEEEILQLRALLHDVMEQHNCRSLRYDAVDYYRALNHLQGDINQLRRDIICESNECIYHAKDASCKDARYGLSATIERHATHVINEFTRVKDGCLQFLSGMMSLNLM